MNINKKCQVLLVEDIASQAMLYQGYLKKAGIDSHAVCTGQHALDYLQEHCPAVLLLDLHLPDMEGMAVLKHIKQQNMPCATVILTADGSVQQAVAATQHGALDYLIKPCPQERLRTTIKNALNNQHLQRLVHNYQDTFERTQYEGFVGASLPMQAVYRIIDSVAISKATAFITGESGTGKEVCAEALHRRSPRSKHPFIALNCAAIPHDLMESELFGHVRGAFTGAHKERIGAAGQADGGTLFLDEICELEYDLQSKLLRFIQTGDYQKVGGQKVEHTDLRILCATNRDPLAEVHAGHFREDLYYRLHIIPLHLPPLRERGDDILVLASHFLQRQRQEEEKSLHGFTPEVAEALMRYDWPGNVRQLQNVIRNIVVLHDGPEVTLAMLPPPINQMQSSAHWQAEPTTMMPRSQSGHKTSETHADQALLLDTNQPLWRLERRIIEHAVDRFGGNIQKAAASLDISASTIYRKRICWESADQNETP